MIVTLLFSKYRPSLPASVSCWWCKGCVLFSVVQWFSRLTEIGHWFNCCCYIFLGNADIPLGVKTSLTNPSASHQGLHRGLWDKDHGAQTRTRAFGGKLPILIAPPVAMGQPAHTSRAPQCSQPPALDTHGSSTSSAASLTQNPGAGSLQGAPACQQEVRVRAAWSHSHQNTEENRLVYL